MQGFSLPLSPAGHASMTPAPPWFYAGNVMLVDFDADPDRVAEVLPEGMTPDAEHPGGAVALFVDWQYASVTGEELVDPVRSQYHEFMVLVNAEYEGKAVHTCPYIYVDQDDSLIRGWIQGWPKKMGQVHTTRAFPLPSAAAPQQAEGGVFGGSLSVSGRRLAEGSVRLESVSEAPLVLGTRPVINMRHFPRLTQGHHDRPAVHELVRPRLSDVSSTEVWEGSAGLEFMSAPGEELAALSPVRVRRGYRYSTTFKVDDLDVVKEYTA